jgi:hypothetical protein
MVRLTRGKLGNVFSAVCPFPNSATSVWPLRYEVAFQPSLRLPQSKIIHQFGSNGTGGENSYFVL